MQNEHTRKGKGKNFFFNQNLTDKLSNNWRLLRIYNRLFRRWEIGRLEKRKTKEKVKVLVIVPIICL